MGEFGRSAVPGQTIDVRLSDGQFDQKIVYDDKYIETAEKPAFSQQITYSDLIRFISPVFNNKIISKSHNYVQDYFELRAQPGQSIGGGDLDPSIDYETYKPRIGSTVFHRFPNGDINYIESDTDIGVIHTYFYYDGGEVSSIAIHKYGLPCGKMITFIREEGEIERIDFELSCK